MRIPLVVALFFLILMLGALAFLVMNPPASLVGHGSTPSSRGEETASDQARLTAALARVSDEVHALRLAMADFSRSVRSEESAATRSIGTEHPSSGPSSGTEPAGKPSSTTPLNSKVGQPDPDKRKRLDELSGSSAEEQHRHDRAHWFLTYEDIIERYG